MARFDAFVSIRIDFFESNIRNIDCCKQASFNCLNACCSRGPQLQALPLIVKLIKGMAFLK